VAPKVSSPFDHDRQSILLEKNMAGGGTYNFQKVWIANNKQDEKKKNQ
jgi:hypothetical protein